MPTTNQSDEQLLAQAQAAIDAINEQDYDTAYDKPRLVAVLNKDRFWIFVKGSDEPMLKLDAMEGQIVAARKARAFYGFGKREETKFPMCASNDANHTGAVPENMRATAMEHGIEDGQLCASCPWNQWGTARSESGEAGAGKACKERRLLLMLLPDLREPVVVSLSPSSIKAWDNYASGLAAQRPSLSYIAVTTRIGVKGERKDGNDFGVAVFSNLGKMDPEIIVQAAQARTEMMPLLNAPVAETLQIGAGAMNEENPGFVDVSVSEPF